MLKAAVSIALCMTLSMAFCFAQEGGWTEAELDKGKIKVQYRISERIDEKGEKVPLIEDRATTVDSVPMQACISLRMDVGRHKDFTGDFSSERIKSLSDREWLVYYYSKNPWPVPDTDCVAVMAYSEDAADKTATFSISAAPDLLESKNVKRASYYNVTYTFKDLGDGKTEITEKGKSSPPVKVPQWMLRSAFPGAPADAIRKIVRLAKATS